MQMLPYLLNKSVSQCKNLVAETLLHYQLKYAITNNRAQIYSI